MEAPEPNISQQAESTHGYDTGGQFNPATIAVTPRQLEILTALEKLLLKKGFSPTYMQLATKVGITSPATISRHLVRLRNKQLVSGGYGHRTLALTQLGARIVASRKGKRS